MCLAWLCGWTHWTYGKDASDEEWKRAIGRLDRGCVACNREWVVITEELFEGVDEPGARASIPVPVGGPVVVVCG